MENLSIWMIIGVVGVFSSAIFVYVLFLILLPEWVGVTGKVALEAERSHREGAVADENDSVARMHRTNS